MGKDKWGEEEEDENSQMRKGKPETLEERKRREEKKRHFARPPINTQTELTHEKALSTAIHLLLDAPNSDCVIFISIINYFIQLIR